MTVPAWRLHRQGVLRRQARKASWSRASTSATWESELQWSFVALEATASDDPFSPFGTVSSGPRRRRGGVRRPHRRRPVRPLVATRALWRRPGVRQPDRRAGAQASTRAVTLRRPGWLAVAYSNLQKALVDANAPQKDGEAPPPRRGRRQEGARHHLRGPSRPTGATTRSLRGSTSGTGQARVASLLRQRERRARTARRLPRRGERRAPRLAARRRWLSGAGCTSSWRAPWKYDAARRAPRGRLSVGLKEINQQLRRGTSAR